eukprot:1248693-Prymnesium_polylepis.2
MTCRRRPRAVSTGRGMVVTGLPVLHPNPKPNVEGTLLLHVPLVPPIVLPLDAGHATNEYSHSTVRHTIRITRAGCVCFTCGLFY